MCIVHAWAISLMMLGVGGDDPAALVEQLGSPRFAEREEASRVLEQLGRAALPALRAARTAEDPEIRSRASSLLDRIESTILVRPTLISLDFHDRLLPEIIGELSQRADVPMHLFPENNPIWKSRRVTLEAATPVPFWEMLDRLSRAAEVQPNVGAGMAFNGRDGVQLMAAAGGIAGLPHSDSGPFRATLHGVHLHRDLSFSTTPMTIVNGGAPQPGRQVVGVRSLPGGGQAAFAVQFSVDLHVVAEPRLILGQAGPIRILDASDEKGQSLLPAEVTTGANQQRYAGYFGSYGGGMTMISTQIQLQPPARLGQEIQRLRVIVPLLVAARKEPPTTMPLADAKGKTLQTGDLNMTIHDIRPEADQTGSISIDLSVWSNPSSDPVPNRAPFDTFNFRSPQVAQSQLEFLDAQGRAYPQWITSSVQSSNEESRITLRLMPHEALGPPSQIRLFDLVRAQTEAQFDFHNIPIP